jgi:predicted protein tyrosine phosphatase
MSAAATAIVSEESEGRRVFLSDLAGVPERLLELRPTHMVSLLDVDDRLCALSDDMVCLRLNMRDVDYQQEGGPTRELVVELIDFVRQLPAEASLLVHCYAGVSRSTAAFLIAHAVRYGTHEEALETARQELEREEPWALPNTLLLRLADRELGAGGRLVQLGRAIRAAADARAMAAEDQKRGRDPR